MPRTIPPSPALTIRAASEGDLAAVLRLYAQPAMDGASTSLQTARATFAEARRMPGYTLYVAESGGNVVGTFVLLIMPNIGHCATPSALLDNVAVAPAQQGQGIGRAMMRFALQTCAQAGCYKVTLSSNLHRDDAHAFYDKLGFERHGYSFRIDPTTVD